MKNVKISKQNEYVIHAYNIGYRIKNNVIYNPNGKIVNGYLKKCGNNKNILYHHFTVTINGVSNSIKVQKLVAYQKFGEKLLQSGLIIRHLDGNSLNNLDENIELGTYKDNSLDRNPEDIKRHITNTVIKHRTFTNKEIEEIREKRESGISRKEIMKEYGIKSNGSYHLIINHNYKTYK